LDEAKVKFGELDTCKLLVMDRVTLHNIVWKLGESKIDYCIPWGFLWVVRSVFRFFLVFFGCVAWVLL
jgi:hypothetical protein